MCRPGSLCAGRGLCAKPISSTSTGFSYAYDADGNRVQKTNGNVTPATGTLYWYMSSGIVAESDLLGNLQSEYVFFGGERVARKDFPGNAVSYYFSDHLKTASVVTDAVGTPKSESDYYPWGGELQFLNGDSNHYKFTGKERDTETGLDYFGARHYSNGLGRFITPDWAAIPVAVPYATLEDPQTLNLYGYVRGNPASKNDLDGHFFWQQCTCPPAPNMPFPAPRRNSTSNQQQSSSNQKQNSTTNNSSNSSQSSAGSQSTPRNQSGHGKSTSSGIGQLRRPYIRKSTRQARGC